MKRQYTRWIFEAQYAQGTGLKIGYIYNKSKGVPEDVIKVRWMSLRETDDEVTICPVEFSCRLDEAVILAAGLNKVAGQMLVEQLPLIL